MSSALLIVLVIVIVIVIVLVLGVGLRIVPPAFCRQRQKTEDENDSGSCRGRFVLRPEVIWNWFRLLHNSRNRGEELVRRDHESKRTYVSLVHFSFDVPKTALIGYFKDLTKRQHALEKSFRESSDGTLAGN